MLSYRTIMVIFRSTMIAWIGFFIALGITFLLWLNARNNAMDDVKTRFERSNIETIYKINNRMETYANTLQSGTALLNTVEKMNRQKWNIYFSSLEIEQHYPGFQGIGFSKVIAHNQLSEHIAQMRRDGLSDYGIQPFGKRAEYHSIIYLEPLNERNKRAIGYDMFTDPIRQSAMIRARDTGEVTLSGKVTLVQENETNIQAGFLMYVPFYDTQAASLTQAERNKYLQGFVYAPFRAHDLMSEILANQDPNIAVKLYDGISVNEENLLYKSDNFTKDKPLFTATIPIEMYGRTWTVVFQSQPSFNATIDSEHYRLIILAGLPISLLLLLTGLSFSQTVERAKIIARKMTFEITALNNELETIIDTAPNPIILHTQDGTIVKINKAWKNNSGYSLEETPTTDIWVDKSYKENHEKVKEHIRSLFTITEKVDEGEFSFYSKSGAKITWQFSSAPFGVIDGKKAVITSAMDVTELKNKDDLMMMQSRHAAMGEMINMIAHQWRQPLASVSAISGLLSLEVMMDQYEKNHFTQKLDLISDLALELSNTINDFRNFFKEDKTKESTTWRELVEGSLTMIRPILITKLITIETSFNEDTSFMTYPREMRQVILNLLKNSEDALTDNMTSEPTIWIRTMREGTMSCLEIEDNGGGIPEQIIKHIFDPYFSTKKEKNGTGIGLYMSKIMVEKHTQGYLSVYNTVHGACFKIAFPMDS
ncbi:MAG: CHASE domain-containing protein [Campylobacterales bacterium]|nr:CHASE domain-containing protein [Campylobacterales bacterium]